jgi:hypothetical protein
MYKVCWLQRQTYGIVKHKCDELKHSETNVTSVIKGENGSVCEALYKVSYHIANCGEAPVLLTFVRCI